MGDGRNRGRPMTSDLELPLWQYAENNRPRFDGPDTPDAAPSSIRHHELWPSLLPFVRVEQAEGSRFRLEVRDAPVELAKLALEMEVQCADCGRTIKPVRPRKAPGNKRSEFTGKGLYLALACPLSVNVGCSRGHAVRDEYQAVKAAVEAAANPLAVAS